MNGVIPEKIVPTGERDAKGYKGLDFFCTHILLMNETTLLSFHILSKTNSSRSGAEKGIYPSDMYGLTNCQTAEMCFSAVLPEEVDLALLLAHEPTFLQD